MSHFPILHLPILPLRDIIDCWSIIESYQFSKLSKKSREITKYCFKTPPSSVRLAYNGDYNIRLNYPRTNFHEDLYVECIRKGEYSFVPFLQKYPSNKCGKLSIISDNPSIDILKEMASILEIFKCSLDFVTIDTQELSIDQTKYIISWMNSIKQKSIPTVHLLSNGRRLKTFLQNFKKPTEKVEIRNRDNNYLDIKGNVGPSGFQCQSLHTNYNHWIQNEELFTLDFVTGKFTNPVNSVDVNKFLKNWREGRSNLKMKRCFFNMGIGFSLDTVLNGLSPTIKTNDGRVENYFHSTMKFTEGKLQIKRDDGTIANIYTGESWINFFVN